jgi:hypothetical protein
MEVTMKRTFALIVMVLGLLVHRVAPARAIPSAGSASIRAAQGAILVAPTGQCTDDGGDDDDDDSGCSDAN